MMLIKILQPKLKSMKIPISFIRKYSSDTNSVPHEIVSNDNFKDWKEKLHSTVNIYDNFINVEEEKSLLDEVEPYLQRLRYEYAHWDNAIHGYRETEFSKWNDENTRIINKIRDKVFSADIKQLKHVHVLDLAEEGWIKPHVDAVRFCGNTIATISLLSDSVMRFTHTGHEKEYWDDFMIPRRSLYVINGTARYDYNHEILCKKNSVYKGEIVNKTRRISIICRSEPE